MGLTESGWSSATEVGVGIGIWSSTTEVGLGIWSSTTEVLEWSFETGIGFTAELLILLAGWVDTGRDENRTLTLTLKLRSCSH